MLCNKRSISRLGARHDGKITSFAVHPGESDSLTDVCSDKRLTEINTLDRSGQNCPEDRDIKSVHWSDISRLKMS